MNEILIEVKNNNLFFLYWTLDKQVELLFNFFFLVFMIFIFYNPNSHQKILIKKKILKSK